MSWPTHCSNKVTLEPIVRFLRKSRCPEQGFVAEVLRDIVVNYVCRDRADYLWQFGMRSKPACAHAERRCAGVGSLTRGNLTARHADCARLTDMGVKCPKKGAKWRLWKEYAT